MYEDDLYIELKDVWILKTEASYYKYFDGLSNTTFFGKYLATAINGNN